MARKIPNIDRLRHTGSGNFFLIAGPCVIENEEITLRIAEELEQITNALQIPFIFKASYRKANRTSGQSFTGIGDFPALGILKKVSERLAIPVLTDVHSVDEASLASQYVDVLQIPAFLCRQTALLEAAGRTGKPVNIKKGQFLSPEMMQYAIDKVRKGNEAGQVLLTERGTSFGYNDLVVDFRSIPTMQRTGCPVIMDITHSCQKPNQSGGKTFGNNEFSEFYGRAAVAVGIDGIFLETHPHPATSLSDRDTILPLSQIYGLLSRLQNLVKKDFSE